MHALLQRQIEQCTSPTGALDLVRLQELISETYQQDATARKRLERAMHLMSEEMQELNDQLAEDAMLALSRFVIESREAMISLWPDDTIGIINRAAGKLLGLADNRALAGTPVQTFLDPACLVEGEIINLDIPVDDGRQIPVTASLSCAVVNGVAVRLVALRDEREQRMREDALDQARRAAEGANQAKSSFLAMMSHELRTPLNAMLGSAELLAKTSLDGRQRELLAMFREAGGLMLALVGDVLDCSKIEAGQLELNYQPYRLSDLGSDIKGMWAGEAERRGLSLNIDMASVDDVIVSADPMRLRQIVFNLVSNGLKFTGSGGVSVSLAAEQAAGRQKVMISVADTGIGIAPDRLERVFDAFVQADSSITRQFGGTGLGLSISRALARQMGGDIVVTSVPGKGSKFTVSLDLGVAVEDALEQVTETVVTLGAQVRILAVEDNELNRRILAAILQQWDMVVSWAHNGVEAVDLAEQDQFDIVLMDVQMPIMDGVTATRMIRSNGGPNARTPVIALTANVSTNDQEGYLTAGMDRFVGKPIQPSQLLAVIAEVLGGAEEPPVSSTVLETV